MTSELHWVKSSYSSNDGPECVEVASDTQVICVRDSKNVQGPRLAFSSASWSALVGATLDRR
ncbi:DUF397 domain-containing protein [Yinghuangia sp. YIM S10712]|uniref:DUF397 domain-containing protein n=1 Tax=Yinghuangia sp. YIM S10712 TaxID=3436930 RepID=UPI003F52A669